MPSMLKYVLLLGLLSACDEEEAPTPSETDDPCAAYSWDSVGAPFTRMWCTSCHSSELNSTYRAGAPAGVNFDDYASVAAMLGRFEDRTFQSDPNLDPMPPGGGPTEEDLARLQIWLDCGAPE